MIGWLCMAFLNIRLSMPANLLAVLSGECDMIKFSLRHTLNVTVWTYVWGLSQFGYHFATDIFKTHALELRICCILTKIWLKFIPNGAKLATSYWWIVHWSIYSVPKLDIYLLRLLPPPYRQCISTVWSCGASWQTSFNFLFSAISISINLCFKQWMHTFLVYTYLMNI